MPALKKLYLAATVNDLVERATVNKSRFKKAATIKLCSSAGRLYAEAMRLEKENDEEKAFIMFFKFIDLVLELKKRPDFPDDTVGKALTNQVDYALNAASVLRESLQERYALLKAANELKKEEDVQTPAVNEENMLMGPNAQSIEPVPAPSPPIGARLGRIIECKDLHDILKDPHQKFMLIDVRSHREFQENHIQHPACMNIPEEILKLGIPQSELESKLSDEARGMWKALRGVDYVILMDYCTEKEDVIHIGHPLRIVEDLIRKVNWDTHFHSKDLIKILKGGFKEWMLSYPFVFGSNSSSSFITSKEVPSNQDKELDRQCNYPDLENVLNEMFEEKSVTNESKITNGYSTDQLFRPAVNRETKPKYDADFSIISPKKVIPDSKEENLLLPNLMKPESSKECSQNVPAVHIPEIDRSLKPASQGPGDWKANENDIISFLNQERDLLRSHYKAERERMEKETEFEVLCMQKALEAEESRREEIQIKEQKLLEKIEELDKRNALSEARYHAAEEEKERMLKQLKEHGGINLEDMKSIAAIESTNKQVLKDLRLLREYKKNVMKSPSLVDKNKTTAATTNINKESFGIKVKNKVPSAGNHSYVRKDVYESGGSGSGLSRSYSSPDITQLIEECERDAKKVQPVVDRSLKPKFSTEAFNISGQLSSARVRNLNPTHGTPPVRGATGLKNLGNTCFMNSTIQCLSNTKGISLYFLSDEFKEHLVRNNNKSTGGRITEELAIVIRALWNGHYKSIHPCDFRCVAKQYISVLEGGLQQDSHEFLIELLDKLHGDLNQASDKCSLPVLQPISDKQAAEAFWKLHRTKNQSKISDTFEGLMRSTLQCSSCGRKSDSFDIFTCISLPISKNECSLEDCLRAFMRKETLSGETAWDCPSCNQKKEADKVLSFCKLPGVLIVQLKRFSYEGRWRKKLHHLVDFSFELSLRCDDGVKNYSLYGVINHIGTSLENGHYTAYCKNYWDKRWYNFNDDKVCRIPESNIISKCAYMLFYSASN